MSVIGHLPHRDFQELDDRTLILAVRADADPKARNVLILRYWDRVHRTIALRAHRQRLGWADVEDAQQEAFFGISDAISYFRPEEKQSTAGCSFPTFADRVLGHDLLDFCRSLRAAQRKTQPLAAADSPDTSTRTGAARSEQSGALLDLDADPALLAEGREMSASLGALLATLDDVDRLIWERRAQHVTQEAIAAELGLTYDQVKRRWQKIGVLARAWMQPFNLS